LRPTPEEDFYGGLVRLTMELSLLANKHVAHRFKFTCAQPRTYPALSAKGYFCECKNFNVIGIGNLFRRY
jgi:hypothetical protein